MKTAAVELWGRKLKLFERSASDVFQLGEISKKSDNPGEQILFMAMAIEDALKPNLKWWTFRLKRMLSYKSILKKCTPSQLIELIDQLNELEGNKKKVKEPESPSGESHQGG